MTYIYTVPHLKKKKNKNKWSISNKYGLQRFLWA